MVVEDGGKAEHEQRGEDEEAVTEGEAEEEDGDGAAHDRPAGAGATGCEANGSSVSSSFQLFENVQNQGSLQSGQFELIHYRQSLYREILTA